MYRLADLIDLNAVQKLADSHFKTTGIPLGVIDAHDDSVLVGSGWQDICTQFHRRHPATLQRCQESDRCIKNWLHEGKPCQYRCLNGLVDISMPIVVHGEHLAHMSIGQFFNEDEVPDRQFFIDQAEQFGFPLEEYLAALDRVPILSREKVETIVEYDTALSQFIADLAEKALSRIMADEKLRESEERFRAVVQQASDGIYLLDPDSKRILEANEAILAMTGYDLDEFRRLRVYDLVQADPEDIDRVLSQEQHFLGERVYRCRDGRLLDVEVSAARVGIGGSKIFCIIVRDITQSKLAKAERERLEARLQQTQKIESIGRLAGGVAHDFNNMLGVIFGYTELGMRAVAPGSRIYASLEKIHQAAEHSANLTRQLLAFARKQVTKPRVIDPAVTIENILKMLRRLVGEEVELCWQPHGDLWPIRIDPVQIDQVLANLCVNARDAIDGVGRITIEADNIDLDQVPEMYAEEQDPGPYVRLTVSDTGCGMDEHTIQQIYEPFFTTKAAGEGTGLGLSTVHGIISQNQGMISVDSKPGQGTTFTIYLPRHRGGDEETPGIVDREAGEALSEGRETILLVEDDPSLLEIAAIMLGELGYTVLAAGRPEEGLQLARSHQGRIDLLLTDVVMPAMTGPDLAGKLAILHPESRVLYMSGYTAENIARRGMVEAGINFIQKPFTLRELGEELRKSLAAREG